MGGSFSVADSSTGRGRHRCGGEIKIWLEKYEGGIDSINRTEIQMAIQPPEFLDDYGSSVFRQTVTAMAANFTLDAVSVPIIERYAAAMMTWRNAEQQMANAGIIVQARRSRVPAINPLVGISRKSGAEARTLEKLLGLAPATRRAFIASEPIDAEGKPVTQEELLRRGFLIPDPRGDL
jgi:P27 family predicted phage terminase small subunit